jgi:tetratricopeptide (TPR) repeat protein
MRTPVHILVLGSFVMTLGPLGLSMALGRDAQSQSSEAAKPACAEPPWKRVPTGDDAKRLEELQQKVDDLFKAGKYREAVAPAREIVTIRVRAQGADHWQVADAQRHVQRFERLASLPAEAQAELTLAHQLNAEGDELQEQRKFPQAQAKFEKALEISRRWLGEENPEVAQTRFDIAACLAGQGKFAEALPLYEKALATERLVLGEDHPDTASACTGLGDTLNTLGRYEEALPNLQKALAIRQRLLGENNYNTSSSYSGVAFSHYGMGDYDEAQRLFQKALDSYRKELGEDHPYTARACNNLAQCFDVRGEYAAAQPLLQQALEIHLRHFGEAHPDTAQAYNNLAVNLDAQGKIADSLPMYQKALDIHRKDGGDNSPGMAQTYNNLAASLQAQGRYGDAQPLLQKALLIHRQLGEEHPYTAVSYNNLAGNLDKQGKHAEAQSLYERALEIRERRGKDLLETSGSYSNLALSLHRQGKLPEAQKLTQKALEITRQRLGEKHPHTAINYNNLAGILAAQGKYPEAQRHYEKALEIQRQRAEESTDTALCYSNLGANLRDQGKYTEARPMLEKGQALRRHLLGEKHPDTITSYKLLAAYYQDRGDYAEAEKHWTTAANGFEEARLRVSAEGLERAAFAAEHSPLLALAALLARRGQDALAWEQLEAHCGRGLLDELSVRLSRRLDEEDRRREKALVDKLGQLEKQIAILTSPGSTAARRAKAEELGKQRDTLQAQWSQWQLDVAAKYGVAALQVYDLSRIQAQIPAQAALLTWVDIPGRSTSVDPGGEHWACLVPQCGKPVWVRLAGSGPQGAWTKDDDELPKTLREILAQPAKHALVDWTELTSRLHTQRVAPVERVLQTSDAGAAVRHLILLPSTAMAGIPMECLTENHSISYAPSGTILAWLRERHARAQAANTSVRPPSLLALGDPALPPSDTEQAPAAPLPDHGMLIMRLMPQANAERSGVRVGDVLLRYGGTKLNGPTDLELALKAHAGDKEAVTLQLWRDGGTFEVSVQPGPLGVLPSQGPAGEAVRARREADRLLRSANGGSFPALPYTRHEVEAIAGLFADKKLLLGSAASQHNLDDLARADALRRFRFLHFATHGILDDKFAMGSALVLVRDHVPDPLEHILSGKEVYNGKLTAEQILRTWKLDAELVTLSACQTALGRPSGGEGYLGFSQALFLAGARSLVLSLWKVEDQATALLMMRFYQNLLHSHQELNGRLAKAWALHEAKQWLRNLTQDQRQQLLADLPAAVRGSVEPLRRTAEPPHAARPYAHPYYWAGFILIGDPGDLMPVGLPTQSWAWLEDVWVRGLGAMVLSAVGLALIILVVRRRLRRIRDPL